MKFKSIFIIFSATLLFFIVALVILPLVMLDSSLAPPFWQLNWPFLLVLVLIFFGFNLFYFTNRQLFLLLEKEDWPALARYLEGRVIKKARYSSRLVRLLANTYLVLSDAPAVMSLESKVAIAKPGIIDKNALVFGTARILGGDISGAVRFFKLRKDTVKGIQKEWVNWYYGFALLLDHQYDEAGNVFSFLAGISKDGVITGLSSFFLSQNISYLLPGKKNDLLEVSSIGKERVLKAFPSLVDWNNEVSRLSSEIHAAAISKYLGETGHWLY